MDNTTQPNTAQLQNTIQPKNIPILDLEEQYKQYGPDLEKTIIAILRSGHFILGPYVSKLEDQIAKFCGSKHAIGVANGTDALILALWALDIGPGDEVITPPFTFAATAEAIALRGAKPVFVDVDPVSFTLNPNLIEKAITPKTKAIMPVHLYGQAAPMNEIKNIANRYGLKIIEDNAQAIGAMQNLRYTGSFGDLACISFYPTKNLGAAGDAGMIVTSDENLAERLRAIRAHGMRKRYYHDELGVNSRLDEIQAAVLLAKLPFLHSWNSKRALVASWYEQALNKCPGIITPIVIPGNTHVWHQYTIKICADKIFTDKLPQDLTHTQDPNLQNNEKLREKLIQTLTANGISSMCYYPVPLHKQEAFKQYGYKLGDFPISEMLASQVLSLPMYPELSKDNVERVANTITQFMNSQLIAQETLSVPTPTNVFTQTPAPNTMATGL